MERSVTRETIAGVAGAGILGVIVFLVSFAPAGFRLWGMDGLAYDPPVYRITFLAGSLVLSLVFARIIARPGNGNESHDREARYLWATLLFLLSILLFLPPATFLRGDGQLLLNNLAAGVPISLRSPLYAVITRAVYSMIVPFGGTPLVTYRLIDALSAIIFALAIVRFSRRFHGPATRVFVLLSFLFSGSSLLLTGLVENYALLHALLAWSLLLALESIERKRFPWFGFFLNLLACGVHVSAITLLPAYLMITPGLRKKNLRWILLAAVAVLAVAAASRLIPEHLLFPLGVRPPDQYTLFSLAHLFDLVNLDFWTVPVLIGVALPVLFFRGADFMKDDADHFLFAAFLGTAGFVFLFSPDLGMARDGDLLAVYGVPATFWILRSLGYKRQVSSWVTAAVLFAGLVTIGSQIFVQARETTDVQRFVRQLERNRHRSYYGWEVLAIHLRGEGDALGEEQAYLKAIHSPPVREDDYKRYLVNLAQLALKRHAPKEALQWCDSLINRDSTYAIAYGIKGKTLEQLGKMDDAEKFFRAAVTLSPGECSYLTNYAAFLLSRNRYRESLDVLLRADGFDDRDARYYFTLGLTWERLGNVSQALQSYHRASTMDPASRWGKSALQAHRALSIMPRVTP